MDTSRENDLNCPHCNTSPLVPPQDMKYEEREGLGISNSGSVPRPRPPPNPSATVFVANVSPFRYGPCGER